MNPAPAIAITAEQAEAEAIVAGLAEQEREKASELAAKAGIPYIQARRILEDAVARQHGLPIPGARSPEADIHGYLIRHFHPSRAERRFMAHEVKHGRGDDKTPPSPNVPLGRQGWEKKARRTRRARR